MEDISEPLLSQNARVNCIALKKVVRELKHES